MGNKGSASEGICRRFLAGSMIALSLGLTLMTGCNSPTLAKAFVSLMPGNTTIGTGLVFPLYVAAAPNGVTWAITGGSNCSGTACGTLSGATSTSVNYIAPVSIPGSSMSVTITATSTTDSTVKASETLSVFPEYVQINGPSNPVVPPLSGASFSATVVNDPTKSGVTWSISGSCSTTAQGCGSFSGKPSITQATFLAPPAAQNETIYVTATSVADPAESASFAVTVPKLAVFVFSPTVLPPAIAGTPYSATVSVYGNTPPYALAVTNISSLPSWAIFNQVGSDTFTITGTPPVGSQGTAYPAIEVTDSTTPVALSAAQSFALTTYPAAATGNGLMNGSYAFYGQGWLDASSIANTIDGVSYIGSFTADGNGNIVGGELDVNGPSGVTSYTGLSGTYDVQYGTDASGNPIPGSQTGIVTLIPAGKPPLPITLAVSLASIQNNVATVGHFVEFDDTTGIGGTQGPNSSSIRVQGSLALQSPSMLNSTASPLSGPYAFGMTGNSAVNDFNLSCLGTSKTCGPISLAGSMVIGSGGAITSGLEDVQVSEQTASAVKLTGSLANSGNTDASGRVTASIAAASNTTMVDWPSNFVIYAVNPQSFYIMSIDSYVTKSQVTGSAMAQNLTDIANAPFSATQPLILYGNIVSSTAYNATKGPNGQIRSELQLFQPSPSSSAAGTMSNGLQWVNASGTYTSTATPGTVGNFTYTVDLNTGRVAVSTTGEPNLYLVDTNTGYGTQQGSGSVAGLFQFVPQTATALKGGAYSYWVANNWSAVGPMETGILQIPATGEPADGSTITLLTGQDYTVFPSNGNAYKASTGETMLFGGPVTGTMSESGGLFSKSAIILPGTMQGCGQQSPQGGGWVISSTSFICAPGGSSYGDIHVFQQ